MGGHEERVHHSSQKRKMKKIYLPFSAIKSKTVVSRMVNQKLNSSKNTI